MVLFINTAKQNYDFKILEKLQNTQTSSKTYGSLLKIFLNNNHSTAVSQKRVCNWFKEKAELFSSFFADHCCLISNSSELPSKLEHLIQSCLSSITFSTDNIAKMIQNLDPNKAQGQDQICIRMLKLCSTWNCKPLEIIFNLVSSYEW